MQLLLELLIGILIGAYLLYELISTLKSGVFHPRGYIYIEKKRHPVLYWFHVVLLGVILLGLAITLSRALLPSKIGSSNPNLTLKYQVVNAHDTR